MSWINTLLQQILRTTTLTLKKTEVVIQLEGNNNQAIQILTRQQQILSEQLDNAISQEKDNAAILKEILSHLTPQPPAAFVVTAVVINPGESPIGVTNMPDEKLKTAVDLQLRDDGTVLYTFNVVDKVGQGTSLPDGTPPLSNITSSDPNLTVALNAADSTGMSLIGTPTLQPGAAVPIVGIVVKAETTFPGDPAPTVGTAAPVDIIGGKAGGFAVAESAQ